MRDDREGVAKIVHRSSPLNKTQPFRNLKRRRLVPIEKTTAYGVAAVQGLMAGNRRIVFDGTRNHSFDCAGLKMHQISRSENARVAHPVLDVNFSVSEGVEPSHQEHDIKSACQPVQSPVSPRLNKPHG